MNKLSSIVLALAFAVGAPSTVWAKSGSTVATDKKEAKAKLAAGEVEVRARVVELDMARRVATLKGPKGNIVDVQVPAEVKNFDQVRVGDELVVRYVVAVLAAIEPVGSSSGIRERVESTTAASAPAGGMPGMAVKRTVEVLVVIKSMDRRAGTVTLRGAKRTVTLKVPEGINMGKIKVGSEVRAVIVEAAVINVERVPALK